MIMSPIGRNPFGLLTKDVRKGSTKFLCEVEKTVGDDVDEMVEVSTTLKTVLEYTEDGKWLADREWLLANI